VGNEADTGPYVARLQARGWKRFHGLPGVTVSVAYDGAVRKNGHSGAVVSCVDLRAHGHHVGLVPINVGVASAHLRTGTLWWYQMRGRQTKFFRKYIVFA
jgi:hypothetical protein